MNIKSILLGTAAGLMVASAAQAADLPSEPTPAAVDYVKVCDAFGTGFFYIPGTENCIKFDGRVRFGLATGYQYTDKDVLQMRTDARFGVDVRTATELGTLRTYVRVNAAGDSTAFFDRGFIQLGYLTVGKSNNFYDYFGGLADAAIADRNWGGDDYTQLTILADGLGGGFYAGIQAHASVAGPMRQTFDFDGDSAKGNTDYPEIEAILGVKDQPWGSAAVALWYAPTDVKGADDFFSVKGGVSVKATDALTINATAIYWNNIQIGNAGNGDGIQVGLGAQYAVSDVLNVYALGAYQFNDPDRNIDADAWGVTLGVDYTIVKGLSVSAEVAYDDSDNKTAADNDWSGIVRLVRSW